MVKFSQQFCVRFFTIQINVQDRTDFFSKNLLDFWIKSDIESEYLKNAIMAEFLNTTWRILWREIVGLGLLQISVRKFLHY